MNHKTQLQSILAGLLEALLLCAIWCTPLFINYYAFQVFGSAKGPLALAFALSLAAIGGAVLLEGLAAPGASGAVRGETTLQGLKRALRHPLSIAAGLIGLALSISTLASILPSLSLYGSLERQMGVFQSLGFLAFFATAAYLGGDPDRRSRMTSGLIGASVPVAIYALAQELGLEVVPGRVESADRAFGTISNPIFMAAFMMLLVPLCWMRLRGALASGRPIVAAGYGLVLLVQIYAMIVSESRGPILGLVAAIGVLMLCAAIQRTKRGLGWLALALGLAGLLFLYVFNMENSPLAPLRSLPAIGRFGDIASASDTSTDARTRIWRSVGRSIASEPRAILLGQGPETLKYTVLPHGETYLAGRGQKERLVDRAHNVTADRLLMNGLLGLAGQLLFYMAWLGVAAQVAGLAPSARDRRALWAFLGLGLGLGLITWFIGWEVPGLGNPLSVYAPALALLGLAGGLGAFLFYRLLFGGTLAEIDRRQDPDRDRDSSRDTSAFATAPLSDGEGGGAEGRALGAALLASGAALVVEAAFGIQTTTTELVAWTLAGLLLALSLAARRPSSLGQTVSAGQSGRSPVRAGRDTTHEAEGPVTISFQGPGLALGLIGAAAGSLLIYSLVIFGSQALAHTYPMMLAGLLLALLLSAADSRAGGLSALATFLIGCGFYTLYRMVVLQIGQDASWLYAATLLWVIALGLVAGLMLRGRDHGAKAARETLPAWAGPVALAYPLLLAAAVGLISFLAVQPVRADIYYQSAVVNFDAALQSDSTERFNIAQALFDRATTLNPREDIYPLLWGERYTTMGAAAMQVAGEQGVEQAAGLFQQAQNLVERAERIDPQMPYHKVNRGHLQLVFAQLLQGQSPELAEGAKTAAANAQVALEKAFEVVNYDPAIVNELATAKWLAGDAEGAIKLLEYSRTLDAENGVTERLLGQVYYTAERLDEAKSAFRRALESPGVAQQEKLSIELSLGEIAREEGKLDEAIAAYESVISQGAADWGLIFNLGLMYRDVGRPDAAAQALEQARLFAPPEAQAQIQAALDELAPE